MKKTVSILCFSFCLLLFSGCNPQPEAPDLLRQAEQLAETNPDSAMLLIDSIFYPEKSLNREQYMNYLVTRVQVRYKNSRDIDGDTLVFDAARYFAQKGKDPKQTARAQFYSGCVRREQNRFEPAMQYYKDAERYAERAKDTNLQGLIQFNIGDLLNMQKQYVEARKSYKLAEQLYALMPGRAYDKQAHALSAIGRMFLLEKNPDSALFYFHKGMEPANHTEDKAIQSLLAQNLSIAYSEKAQYGDAEKYLRQSFVLNNDSSELPRYYLNFARLYSNMEQPDSAGYYTELLKQHINTLDNTYFKASAYSYLANREKKRGNYDAAFSCQNKRMQVLAHIMEERGSQSVYEALRKYDYEQIQKQYYHTLSNRLQWIIALMGVVIVGGVFFTWYWVRQRKRKAEIQLGMDTLEEMNRDLKGIVSQKNLNLRKELLWRFDIVSKVLEINEKINSVNKTDTTWLIKQFNKTIYGGKNIDNQWDAMFEAFGNARPGLAEKIRDKYPAFTKTEFRVCILTYAGFPIKEIALILKQSPSTIQNRRTDIRNIMGIDPGGDIADYIDQIFG